MGDGSWFHVNRSTVKRSEGRNAVATAAYCAGLSIYDKTEQTTHDYSRKAGVAEAFVTTPAGKPGLEWAHDIAALSNAMEAHERRKDAQVAHQFRIALPASDLNTTQRSALTRDLAQHLSDMYGVAVIAGIHEPDARGDIRNHHAHLAFTTREVEPDGELGAKVTSITSPKTSAAEVTRFREVVAELTNEALEEAGSDTRVSSLSYEARGIEREPTTHLGPAASGMERNGVWSDRVDDHKAIIAERIAEQERLSAAIARHVEHSPPELTLETERELARRFSEEWQAVATDAASVLPADGEGEWQRDAPAEDALTAMHPELEQIAVKGTTHASGAIHCWMQAQTRRFFQLLRDESGAPDLAPEPTPKTVSEAAQDTESGPGQTEGRSFISRILEAGRNALHSWQYRNQGPEEAGIGPPEESGGDTARPGGNVEPPAPDALRPQNGQERPMSAFERLVASVDAWPPEQAAAKGPSAFHQVMAEPAEAAAVRPPTTAPEPSSPAPEL